MAKFITISDKENAVHTINIANIGLISNQRYGALITLMTINADGRSQQIDAEQNRDELEAFIQEAQEI